MDLFSLKGRKAVLLGGGGILGAAMAKGLYEAGADVAVCDLDLEKARSVADSISSGTAGDMTSSKGADTENAGKKACSEKADSENGIGHEGEKCCDKQAEGDDTAKPVVRAYRVDAMDIESIRETAKAILSDFGRVDILVNAVGGNMKEPPHQTKYPFSTLTQGCSTGW